MSITIEDRRRVLEDIAPLGKIYQTVFPVWMDMWAGCDFSPKVLIVSTKSPKPTSTEVVFKKLLGLYLDNTEFKIYGGFSNHHRMWDFSDAWGSRASRQLTDESAVEALANVDIPPLARQRALDLLTSGW